LPEQDHLPGAQLCSWRRSLEEDVEELAYPTDQGTQRAWIHPAKAGGVGTVWLVFGGNGTVALDWPGWLPLRQGRTFVLVDYPGYGASEGRPTPGHVRDSIRALLPALAAHWKTTPEALRPQLRSVWPSAGRRSGSDGHE